MNDYSVVGVTCICRENHGYTTTPLISQAFLQYNCSEDQGNVRGVVRMLWLSNETFKSVVAATPLVSIDLIVENEQG